MRAVLNYAAAACPFSTNRINLAAPWMDDWFNWFIAFNYDLRLEALLVSFVTSHGTLLLTAFDNRKISPTYVAMVFDAWRGRSKGTISQQLTYLTSPKPNYNAEGSNLVGTG